MPRLFLDCDGVLADFEGGAQQLFGMSPAKAQARFGRGGFWKKIAAHGDFYNALEPLSDAALLVDAVRPLDPIILTGLPLGQWAEPQKRRWAERHFPGLPVITCMARDKHCHGAPGDVLVDDTVRNGEAWQRMGGVFVHHESAARTLAELRGIFPSLAA